MTTLFGALSAHLTADYEKQTSALRANTALVNRFGDAAKALGLTPHVNATDRSSIRLVAVSERGRDCLPLLETLTQQGFNIGEPVQAKHQFTDGFLIWSVDVTSRTLSFDLVYYTKQGGAA